MKKTDSINNEKLGKILFYGLRPFDLKFSNRQAANKLKISRNKVE